MIFRSKPRHDRAALLLNAGVIAGLHGLGLITGAPSELASAIAQAEGYGPSTNIATLANNPGNLVIGDIGYGTITAAGGIRITKFATAAAGWAALQNQIDLIASGSSSLYPNGDSMSIAQVGAIYSGDSSGTWAKNVASILGVDPSSSFAQAAGDDGGGIFSDFPSWAPWAAMGTVGLAVALSV